MTSRGLKTTLFIALVVAAQTGCLPVNQAGPPTAPTPEPEDGSPGGGLTGGDTEGAPTGGVALSGAIWKSDVVVLEPVLVRIEVTNQSGSSVSLVPPYMNCYERANWPLTLTVKRGDGGTVPNGWSRGTTGTEPVAFGLPWWIPQGHRVPGSVVPPRWPWTIEAGSAGHMWFDLLQFYPLHAPGRYQVILHYRPEAGMSGETSPEDLWLENTDIDLGWVTVGEPQGGDARAVAWLERAGGKATALSSESRDLLASDLRGEFLKRCPDTVYAPYAEFYRLLRRGALRLRNADDRADLGQQVQAFVTGHPDFPLNEKLHVIVLFAEWRARAPAVPAGLPPNDPARERLSRLRIGPEVTEAEAAVREAVAQTQDLELRQWVERSLWQWHQNCRELGLE